MRRRIVILCLSLKFLAVVLIFWRYEWLYTRPTPVPAHYRGVEPGSVLTLPGIHHEGARPLFLHFFNPDCPCSRFNIGHFQSLVRQYGQKVDFKIVVMTKKPYTEKEIQDKLDVTVPVSFDTSIAVACGVYSTPQAVIIGRGNTLYYRGNYNKSRYCTLKASNYAQQALEGLLHGWPALLFDRDALTAYGCRLPNCYKE